MVEGRGWGMEVNRLQDGCSDLGFEEDFGGEGHRLHFSEPILTPL